MSIKLDWRTEAEHGVVPNAGEDPEARRGRRAARARFLWVVLSFIAVGAALVAVVVMRLREADAAIERQLRTTVEAEVAALRIGDETAYMDVQWEAEDAPNVTADWVARQQSEFAVYQTLKQEAEVNLTGRVLDVAVEGQNGRVRVEEIIDGVPYGRVWFYWRFQEGWQHVPPAFGFWGDAGVIERERIVVRYRGVDADIAANAADTFVTWTETLCAVFGCEGLPSLTVELAAEDNLIAGWSPSDPWTLRLPSPYLDRARLDRPFEGNLRRAAAALVIDRFTAPLTTNDGTDADYLKDAIIAYLTESFTATDTGSNLITSLAEQYGIESLRRLWSNLTPESTIGVLVNATNEPLDGARLDWLDFVTYRVNRDRPTGGPYVARFARIESLGRLVGEVVSTLTTDAPPVPIVFTLTDGDWQLES